MKKKKPDMLTILLYGIIIFAVLYVSAALGAAMDLSVNDEGVLDFNLLMAEFETVLTATDIVGEHFTDFSSYSFKITLMVSFALGIYALLKMTSQKRLHRKGVEHGSARWATEKEEKFLADKPEKIIKSETFTDESGKKHTTKFRVQGENCFIVTLGKVSMTYGIYDKDNEDRICADFNIPRKTARKLVSKVKKCVKKQFETDNNIILTQEVRMSLNTRQHRENLNVLVIGGSGSGKSRFYVKPNLMQLNTSYVVTDPKGELLRSCGRLMKKAGYEIRVFNLIDMAHSNNYNPFNYIYDKDGNVNKTYVMKMVNCLMKNTKQEGSSGGDQFWDDSTKALILAISFYLLEKADAKDVNNNSLDRNFSTVMKMLILSQQINAPFIFYEILSEEKLQYITDGLTRAKIPFVEDTNGLHIPDYALKTANVISSHFKPTATGTIREQIALDIDRLIFSSADLEELLAKLKEKGYEIKRGKHLAVKAPFAERFIRLKSLGKDYLQSELEHRISEREEFPRSVRREMPNHNAMGKKVCVTILETTTAIQQLRIVPRKIYPQKVYGYRNDERIRYLAMQLKAIQEFGVSSYDDVTAKSAELKESIERRNAEIKAMEDEIPTLKYDISQIRYYFSNLQNRRKLDTMGQVKFAAAKETAEKYGISSEQDIAKLEERLRLLPAYISAERGKVASEQEQLKRITQLGDVYEKIINGNYIDNLIKEQREQEQKIHKK